jgi:carboxymethylenebutenolidase
MAMTDPSNNGYLAIPQAGRGAGVLVLHAWWGLTDFIRELCDRLAQEGFVALAPDLFSGELAQTVEEAQQHQSTFDEEHVVPPVVLAALETLRSHPAVRGRGLGVVGFSMGAYWALWLAMEEPDLIRAVTLFYGSNGGGGDFSQSQAAFLGNFAEQDPYEPPEGVHALEKNLREAGRPVHFYTYPETGHWFFEKDRPEAFHRQAAQRAWERTLEFLQDQLEQE